MGITGDRDRHRMAPLGEMVTLEAADMSLWPCQPWRRFGVDSWPADVRTRRRGHTRLWASRPTSGTASSGSAGYALRPVVAQDRLHLTAEGQVVLQVRHAWSDGTTHLLFDPLELLERLAVLTLRPFENLRVAVSLVERRRAQGHPEQGRGMIPRPRINLILYHGVLALRPCSGWPCARAARHLRGGASGV